MSRTPPESELESEVRELTRLLREDPSFDDIRSALVAKGIAVSNVILAGLIEGEDESQYGVAITSGLKCIRFDLAADGSVTEWAEVVDIDSLTVDFQAVKVAVQLAKHRWGSLEGRGRCGPSVHF